MFIPRAPLRGFEKMAEGKNPLFAVEAVMRICGLCHTSHGIACSEAIECSTGILPPRCGLLLRECLGILNRIQSHLLQLVMVLPDLYLEREKEGLMLKIFEVYSVISEALLRLGGAPTHPPYITIGGILKAPKETTLSSAKRGISEGEEKWSVLQEELLDEDKMSEVAEELRERKYRPEFLASHTFYGDKYNVNPKKVERKRYWEYRREEEAKESNSLIATYGGREVEVGPRARGFTYFGFKDSSLLGLHFARIQEISLNFMRLSQIFDELKPDEPYRTRNLSFGPGSGVGVFEAPRGTLFHFISLGEEGRVRELKIVVPTMFNIPIMERACKGLSLRAAEAVVRLYDPCVPCTVHYQEVRK